MTPPNSADIIFHKLGMPLVRDFWRAYGVRSMSRSHTKKGPGRVHQRGKP